MTGTMRRLSKTVLSIGAALAIVAAVSAQPAAAYDAEAEAVTATEASAAMAWMLQARPKARHIRYVRVVPPARVASLAKPPYVLMLGIGF